MSDSLTFSTVLPPAPARIFCVGIGGIGVSALAQLLRWCGHDVCGSDRGLEDASKSDLYDKLRRQGIRLYPQDGSGVTAEHPDVLIISNAVEAGNPDLVAGEGIPLLHRARALAKCLNALPLKQIAVAGSCGKTSVTGWLASALHALGEPVMVVNGGYLPEVENDALPGNFAADDTPRWAVVEVDESDKSISEFTPDYGVLLNVGNDHYEQDELKRVFGNYLGKCNSGICLLQELLPLAAECAAPVSTFAPEPCNGLYPTNYRPTPDGIVFDACGLGHVKTTQTGRHSALNACAVLATLKTLGLPADDAALCRSLGAFQGVRQRFEVIGKTAAGIPLVNDYAHNPEKIAAAISACRERFGSPLLCTFQPHGFTPLKFMRDALGDALATVLKPGDTLVLLPVYYAGGTAAFSPTSDEVAAEYQQRGLPVQAATREHAEKLAEKSAAKAILVMGARDASLRSWTKDMCAKPRQ